MCLDVVANFKALSVVPFEGTHPGDLLHVWQDQDDRHAHEPRPPTPVQRLRLRGV